MGSCPGIWKRGRREPLDLKKRKERTSKSEFQEGSSRKNNPQVLKILKFRGNKIDRDCEMVKVTQKSKKIILQNNSVDNS